MPPLDLINSMSRDMKRNVRAELHFQHYTTSIMEPGPRRMLCGGTNFVRFIRLLCVDFRLFQNKKYNNNKLLCKINMRDREERLQNSFKRASQSVVLSPKDISWMKTENPHSELVTASSRWHLTFLHHSINIVDIQICRYLHCRYLHIYQPMPTCVWPRWSCMCRHGRRHPASCEPCARWRGKPPPTCHM